MSPLLRIIEVVGVFVNFQSAIATLRLCNVLHLDAAASVGALWARDAGWRNTELRVHGGARP
jgi:hypothetical protein